MISTCTTDAAIEAVLEMVPPPTPGGEEEEEEGRGRKFTMGGEVDKESGYASSDNESNYSDRSDEEYEMTRMKLYGTKGNVPVATPVIKKQSPTSAVSRCFRKCQEGWAHVWRALLGVWPACGRVLVWGLKVWSVWGSMMLLDVVLAGLMLVVWGEGVRLWKVLGAGLLCVLVSWEVCGVAMMLSIAVWTIVTTLIRAVLWLAVACLSCMAGVWEFIKAIYRREVISPPPSPPRPSPVPDVVLEEAGPVAVQKEWGMSTFRARTAMMQL